ncbi:SpaA isopeptide-forming pilin-related protein [Streptomyces sp. NPDC051677]|uniref:SpaA isopeptide-forming pilin-related protein n=1 Tax=Streptomyces sp. NPDC051677 TaxID=3365669 RepID=UPI0037D35F98
MRITPARRLPVAAAVAAAVTSTLTWAPTATAQPTEPTPSAAVTDTPQPDAGSIGIVKKDPAGDILEGAAFLLLDAAGQETGSGTTDAQGQLTFTGLAPGVYRLKETTSGSPLHDVIADQDVIVTPGATARLTIVDPFKPAQVLLKAKDNKTGKLLPGATVNIGTGEKTLLTLTTGPKGTATGELAVPSRKAEFWVKQVKAPKGYELSKPVKTFTAGPGAPVTVTVTNTKTATTPKPTEKPTDQPTANPSMPTDSPAGSTSGGSPSNPPATGTPDTDTSVISSADGTDPASPKTPVGSLAHTGADATPWILGGAGLMLVGGIGAIVAARRRTGSEPEPDENADTN